jgi:hypothetical protein
MEAFAPALEKLVIDGVAAYRLDKLMLDAAVLGDGNQHLMGGGLSAIEIVAHVRCLEAVDMPWPDATMIPMAFHRRLDIAHEIGYLHELSVLHDVLPEMGSRSLTELRKHARARLLHLHLFLPPAMLSKRFGSLSVRGTHP